MRARIHQNCRHGLYWGQVFDEKKGRWESVTLSYITRAGAMKALKRWAKQHRKEEEFEI